MLHSLPPRILDNYYMSLVGLEIASLLFAVVKGKIVIITTTTRKLVSHMWSLSDVCVTVI